MMCCFVITSAGLTQDSTEQLEAGEANVDHTGEGLYY